MIKRYTSAIAWRVRKYGSQAIRPIMDYNTERKFRNAVQIKAPAPRQDARRETPYKVAVIGAGGMGQDQCVGMKTLRNVEIVGVVDRNLNAVDRLRREAGLPNARGYESAEALLQAEKPDLVCIATNTTSHIAVARLAVEAGVRKLIVEKPIGNSVARARELARLCAEKNVKVTVNHSRRWSNDYAAIRRCVEHGYIGALHQVYLVPGPGGLAMIGVHFFDLLAYLANSSFAWVIGFLDSSDKPNRRGAQFKDPGGYAMVGLRNGVRGYVDISDDLNRKDLFVVLKGEAGRIEVDERMGTWTVDSSALGRRTFQFQDATDTASYFAKVAGEMLSDSPTSCGAQEGVEALEAVVATHVSHHRGHALVNVPLEDADAEPEFAFP